MLLGNFFYKFIYQFKNDAIYPVFWMFIKDRLMHPFLSKRKKKFKKNHQDFLKSKKYLLIIFRLMLTIGIKS